MMEAGFQVAPMDIDTAVDPRWLSQALSAQGEPVEVSDVKVIDKIGPSALSIRIEVAYGATPAKRLPNQFCIKGVFDEKFRASYIDGGTQKRETNFYRDIAPRLSMRTPICYYGGVDEETSAAIIVMEDLIASGGRILSVHSPYSIDQASQSLDQLARLHAESRELAEAGKHPWVINQQARMGGGFPPEMISRLMSDPRGDNLPPELRDGQRILDGMGALARRGETIPSTFVHGDAHAANLFEDPDGIGFLDWQVIQRANWSIDVGYHVATVLAPDDRRRSEKDLLKHYLDRRAAHGDRQTPGFEEAWLLYRQSIAYGYFMWAVTQRVVPHTIVAYVQRISEAMKDHDPYGLLGV